MLLAELVRVLECMVDSVLELLTRMLAHLKFPALSVASWVA